MQAPPPIQPTAQGSFAKTPFPHLLVYAIERGLSGTFELSAPGESGESLATVLVSQGVPAKVRTTAEVHYLGDVMLALEMIDEEALKASQQRMAESPRLQGQILKELGAVDDAGLEAGIRAQLERKLDYLFTLPAETVFSYFDGVDQLQHFGGAPVPIDPFPALWRGIRQTPLWDHVEATMNRVGAAAVRIVPNARIDRFQFTPTETRAVDLLREQPRRTIDLANAKVVGPGVAQLLIYLLVITKQVDLLDPAPMRQASPPSGGQAFARVQLQTKPLQRSPLVIEEAPVTWSASDGRLASPFPQAIPLGDTAAVSVVASEQSLNIPLAPAAPVIAGMEGVPPVEGSEGPGLDINEMISTAIRSSMPPPMVADQAIAIGPSAQEEASPEQDVLRQRILARSVEISSLDYFQMLGLEPDATSEAIQKAFIGLAKVWHPDRLPPALRDVKDACGTVFSYLTEARTVLCDAERRAEYMHLLKDGGATPDDQAKIQEILEAAMVFQKAEAVLKRNDTTQAYEFAKRAHSLDPEQADYLAMVTWIEAQRPDSLSRERTLEKVAILDRCLTMNPKCERAFFWRGMLFKRIDENAKALRDFKAAGDLNPRNLDALREVRLHNLRRGPARPSKPPGGPTAPKPGGIGGMFGKLFKK